MQVFPEDHVAAIETRISSKQTATGEDLLLALEQALGIPMPLRVKKIVSNFTYVGKGRLGRPTTFGAAMDFAMEEIHEKYPARLAKYEQERKQLKQDARLAKSILPKAETTPRELAYTELALEYRSALGPSLLHWRSLCNLHLRWRNGDFHQTDENAEPFEFDEMVDLHYPAPKSSRE